MHRSVVVLMLAAALAVGAGSTRAQAAATTPAPQPTVKYYRTYDLTRIKCADLLQANLMDRSSAVMFIWGYEAGRKGITSFDTVKLENATQGLMQTCEAKPSLTILAAAAEVQKRYAK
ncbi:MAG: hypothetical protein JOZ91_08735 [Candidatus Eremiobacteraeota bacterium]|nr:hypothetical protein [Candidatus Eremiobacteraeota bacterium]MBV8204001.1 hypothetical protein [Candidatus Eremiobacteraeota bacterium]MBV8263768.1 hypothetical protein [Candidatus Eremiobacteraeota bacterium]MBV8339756.1 hypothetical protein [Candidatus Eremiobacteraeota bacterium]MBV8461132.1 hypothetical protein [Candidatus Eremiobacteraeota bacterium]